MLTSLFELFGGFKTIHTLINPLKELQLIFLMILNRSGFEIYFYVQILAPALGLLD